MSETDGCNNRPRVHNKWVASPPQQPPGPDSSAQPETLRRSISERLLDPRRLGGGGSLEESDQRRSTTDAQNHFLRAVAVEVPDALRDLANGPYERFRYLAGEAYKHRTNTPTVRLDDQHGGARVPSWAEMEAVGGRSPEAAVCESVVDWGNRWHLTSPWCWERALATLYWWDYAESWGRPLDRSHLDWTNAVSPAFDPPHLGHTVSYTYDLRRFDPRVLDVDLAEQWVLEDLAQQVKEDFDRIRNAARHAGLVEIAEKRKLDHFAWAALWQVGKVNFATLARKVKKDRATVREAVRGVLRQVRLPERS